MHFMASYYYAAPLRRMTGLTEHAQKRVELSAVRRKKIDNL